MSKTTVANGAASMNDPTSVMWPVYEGRTCLPTNKGSNSTCAIGAYPTYAVNATTVAQIQLAVNFARNKGLRIVIKNTGHDYLGKSCGAGALSIWTYHLKSLEFMSEYTLGNFTGKALHAGSGVGSLDVQRIAYENDASAVGGMCAVSSFREPKCTVSTHQTVLTDNMTTERRLCGWVLRRWRSVPAVQSIWHGRRSRPSHRGRDGRRSVYDCYRGIPT